MIVAIHVHVANVQLSFILASLLHIYSVIFSTKEKAPVLWS